MAALIFYLTDLQLLIQSVILIIIEDKQYAAEVKCMKFQLE
jgi:hypothetical protein